MELPSVDGKMIPSLDYFTFLQWAVSSPE